MEIDPNQATIKQADLVNWLCAKLYPGQKDSADKKRIRNRIDYARQTNRLPNPKNSNAGILVEVRPFFSWARGVKGWERLHELIAMPADLTVNVSGVNADALTSDAYAFGFPESISELLLSHAKLKEYERALPELKKRIKEKENRSANAKRYGKMGGRPRNG